MAGPNANCRAKQGGGRSDPCGAEGCIGDAIATLDPPKEFCSASWTAEQEKLKFRKLQDKADTLLRMKSQSRDQMEMDDIALHRFKNMN